MNTPEPATMAFAPASATSATVPALMPPSTSRWIGRDADHLADVPDLVELRRDEGLAAEARVHRHHQDEVDLVEHM